MLSCSVKPTVASIMMTQTSLRSTAIYARRTLYFFAVNKWDAVEKDGRTMQEYRRKLESDFSFMSYVPFLFISAKTGQRVDVVPAMFETITRSSPAIRLMSEDFPTFGLPITATRTTSSSSSSC